MTDNLIPNWTNMQQVKTTLQHLYIKSTLLMAWVITNFSLRLSRWCNPEFWSSWTTDYTDVVKWFLTFQKMFLWNVTNYLPSNPVSHSRRPES